MSHPETHKTPTKKKKSRTTIAILVCLALMLVLIMTFPGVDPDATFTERLEYIFADFLPETEDEEDNTTVIDTPEYTQPQSEEDAAFIALMEDFISEDVEGEYERMLVLQDEYLPLFEAVPVKKLVDPMLQTCAKDMVALLKDWDTSIYVNDKGEIEGIEDWLLWSQSRVDLCNLVIKLQETYSILPDMVYATQQYEYTLPIWEAQLEVQKDLHKQLSKPKKVWSAEEKCYYITYTNNTEFEMDVTIYGDYFTAEHRYFTDKIYAEGLKPGESVTLYMKRMPKDMANWVADWVVKNYYVDGIDIYDFY